MPPNFAWISRWSNATLKHYEAGLNTTFDILWHEEDWIFNLDESKMIWDSMNLEIQQAHKLISQIQHQITDKGINWKIKWVIEVLA